MRSLSATVQYNHMFGWYWKTYGGPLFKLSMQYGFSSHDAAMADLWGRWRLYCTEVFS